tara:strand:- start:90 stop:572 length:483 start_codon:yes stop_codon:yes gene_type:complete
MRAIRTHGVENVKDPECWAIPGFNFRFTDIQASIGIEQLKLLPEKIDRLKEIYQQYLGGLASIPALKSIPVNLETGEVPMYNEFLCEQRGKLIKHLDSQGIETRPFFPDLNHADYLNQGSFEYPNSRKYGENGIYLPSGPAQNNEGISRVIECIERAYTR